MITPKETKANVKFWIDTIKPNDSYTLQYFIYDIDDDNEDNMEAIDIRVERHTDNKFSSYTKFDSDTFNREYELLIYATKNNTINKIVELVNRAIDNFKNSL